jgi:hypothetical protein
MINPLAQRQIHQASNVEALRQAADVAEQLQRELGRKRAADERLAEAQSEVPLIPRAEAMRTEDRRSHEKNEGFHPGGSQGEGPGDLEDEPGDDSAKTADNHLDILA